MQIRPIHPDDLPGLTQLYRETALVLGSQWYTPQQVQAWARSADDESRFRRFLFDPATWVAVEDAELLGFAGITADGHITSLYVRHDRTRAGIGTALLRHVLEYAQAHGMAELRVEASIFSQPVFERHGFVLDHIERTTHNGVTFSRPVLRRQLT